MLIEYCARYNPKKIFTLEEHQRVGGFGSLISEEISAWQTPLQVIRFGINDVYGQSGEPEELLKFFELDRVSVAKNILKNL